MKIDLIQIDKVIPYTNNPRKNEMAVTKVAASIKGMLQNKIHTRFFK